MYLTFDLQDTEIHIKLYKDVLRIPVLLKLLLKSGNTMISVSKFVSILWDHLVVDFSINIVFL